MPDTSAACLPFAGQGPNEWASRTLPATIWCCRRRLRLPQRPSPSCITGAGGAQPACKGVDSDLLQVAAALLRRVLAHRPSLLRLEAERADGEVALRLSYPTSAQWTYCDVAGAAADLALIDALATRWGHSGNQEWHVLWAVVADDPGEPNRDDTSA